MITIKIYIQPKDKETQIYRKEEERVTLSCSYDTGGSYVYLYWYRQFSNREPEFLLWKGARSGSSSEYIPHTRFQSTTSQTSTELSIKSVTLSDSALYYCALKGRSKSETSFCTLQGINE
uniref:Ig-like domain-containing protein n=1 Tax=Sinocyclocheilus anshuiensis TaxID=1608454 RepID=A0A671Q1T7_9TELE